MAHLFLIMFIEYDLCTKVHVPVFCKASYSKSIAAFHLEFCKAWWTDVSSIYVDMNWVCRVAWKTLALLIPLLALVCIGCVLIEPNFCWCSPKYRWLPIDRLQGHDRSALLLCDSRVWADRSDGLSRSIGKRSAFCAFPLWNSCRSIG